MQPLQFSFLGSWEIVHPDCGQLVIKRGKTLALIAYLAVERAQTHSRDSLLGLLWPEMDDKRARNNLRVTLSRLNRLLAVGTQQTTGPITSSRLDVQLVLRPDDWLDLTEFQSLLAATSRHPHPERSRCPDCQTQLAHAAALYRGEFLAGFHLDNCPAFDEWQLIQRERYHVQVQEILAELTAYHMEDHDLVQAERYARRQIELDPLHEAAYRQLMTILSRRGQRGAAIAMYRLCAKRLLGELGIAPDPETARLYEQIAHQVAPAAADGVNDDQGVRGETESIRSPPYLQKLPYHTTPFVGRGKELADISTSIERGQYRLLTLTGLGGIGKTRLAIEAALANHGRFADGVAFVSLASVESVDKVATAIFHALAMEPADDQRFTWQQLCVALADRRLLLVLDNMEHLTDAAHLLLDLLQRAPQVILLVTSREQLRCQAEDLHVLSGLPIPTQNELAQAGEFPAVRLFCDRAYRVNKRFRLTPANRADIVRICSLVEGLPLALELAAAWASDFDCAHIARAIASNLAFLQTDLRDVPNAHRSIMAVFDNSWRLLSSAEQITLAQLSIFQGTIGAVAGATVTASSPLNLARLCHKSLLQNAGSGRYNMHELIRQYASMQLATRPQIQETVARAYAEYFLHFVRKRIARLKRASQENVLAELDEESTNLDNAWSVAVAQQDYTNLLEAVEGFAIFCLKRYRYAEGLRACEQLLARIDRETTGAAQTLQAICLTWQAFCQQQVGEFADALHSMQECRRILPAVQVGRAQAEAFYMFQLGNLYFQSDLEEADASFAKSARLYSSINDQWFLANVLERCALIYHEYGRLDEALQFAQTGLTLRRQLGIQRETANAMTVMADITRSRRQVETSEALASEAVAICRALGDQHGLAVALGRLSIDYLWSGRARDAIPMLQEAVAILDEINARSDAAYWRTRIALVRLHLGQYEKVEAIAARILESASTSITKRVLSWCLQMRGCAAMGLGEYREAAPLLRAALAQFEERATWAAARLCRGYLGFALFHLGERQEAQTLFVSQLAEALDKRRYILLCTVLTGTVLLQVDGQTSYYAARSFYVAESQPFIGASCWFEDIACRRINTHLASLPKSTRQQAQRWVAQTDFWQAATDVVKARTSLASDLPS